MCFSLKYLGSSHQGSIATIESFHVPLNVGIPEQGENSNLRHPGTHGDFSFFFNLFFFSSFSLLSGSKSQNSETQGKLMGIGTWRHAFSSRLQMNLHVAHQNTSERVYKVHSLAWETRLRIPPTPKKTLLNIMLSFLFFFYDTITT